MSVNAPVPSQNYLLSAISISLPVYSCLSPLDCACLLCGLSCFIFFVLWWHPSVLYLFVFFVLMCGTTACLIWSFVGLDCIYSYHKKLWLLTWNQSFCKTALNLPLHDPLTNWKLGLHCLCNDSLPLKSQCIIVSLIFLVSYLIWL